MGNSPFASILATEDSEEVAGIIAELGTPVDVAIVINRVRAVIAFHGAAGIGRIDEIGAGLGDFEHFGQILRTFREVDRGFGAGQISAAAIPDTAGLDALIGILGEIFLIPARGVLIHILVVIVQAGGIAGILDSPDRFTELPIAAAFGCRGQNIRMLIVVASVDPAAHAEEDVIHLEIILQMLGHFAGLFKGPVDDGMFLFLAGFIHFAIEHAPEFEIGRAPEILAQAVLLGLYRPGDVEADLLGHLGFISSGDLVVITLTAGIETESAGVFLLDNRGAQGLLAFGIDFALQTQGGIAVIPGEESGGVILGEAPEADVAAFVGAVAKLTLENFTGIGRDKHTGTGRHQHPGSDILGSQRESAIHHLDRNDIELAGRMNSESNFGLIAGEHCQDREVHIGNLSHGPEGHLESAPLNRDFAILELGRKEAVIDLVSYFAKAFFA